MRLSFVAGEACTSEGDCLENGMTAQVTERERRVRERAYQLWLDADKPDGREMEHWQEAEKQIAEEKKTELKPRARKAPRVVRVSKKT